jgi:dolichol-phosphate mannosyltransferase
MVPIVALTAYALLLKFFYLGLPELLHEEAYYWNYSQHLDIGYLDHPPMVAWVAKLFTGLMGDSAFAVRLGPFVLWFLGALYTFRLARRIFGKKTAIQSVLLYAVLPYFFLVSMLLLPDSFLVVCWSGALYYIHALLIEEKPWSFLGVGIFIGLGMLSKYSISLLGLAALLFVVFDHPSRKWLGSAKLWLAIAVSLVIFSPVIVWNAKHEWVSILFQSARRATGSFDFDLTDLVGSVIVLITPIGLIAAWIAARSKAPFVSSKLLLQENEKVVRSYRLLMVLTVVPLSVFVFFSLFRNTKLNWTGPLWLGILPFMSHMMSAGMEQFKKKLPVFGPRPWIITVITLLLIYGAGLLYIAIGIPGIPYPKNLLGLGVTEIARDVEHIVEEIGDRNGVRPLVVGMDKYSISSWLAFYRGKSSRYTQGRHSNQGVQDTAGRNLFGSSSLMYGYWFPPSEQVGKTMVLVGRRPKDLTGSRVEQRIDHGGEVRELVAKRHGRIIRRYYYRVVEGCRPLQPS